uniref:Farnesoic acid O-methyl transferase domain-containing protein n=1 Tax=Anopheles christyi TaxID=43041 RepID=A0A182KGF2_9DIPT
MAFTKMDKDLVFFYDCPMDVVEVVPLGHYGLESIRSTDSMNALLGAVATVLISILFPAEAYHTNSFDGKCTNLISNIKQHIKVIYLKAVKGCKQYGNVANYNDPLVYIPTGELSHLGVTSRSKYFKVAIQGRAHGHIRYGTSLYPYNKEVIEIVIGGWENTKSAGRRQYRPASNQIKNTGLVEARTPNLLSLNRPTMFMVELFHDGTIQARIDGQDHPFLSFKDSTKIPFNYIAFVKWASWSLVYFYDCPLDKNVTICYKGGKIQVNQNTVNINESKLTNCKVQNTVYSAQCIKMQSLKGVTILAFVYACFVGALGNNSFERIKNCKQYNTVAGYDGPLQYLPLANLQHVRHTDNSKVLKIGILGENDGIIRYGRYQFPYESDVIEIVIRGCKQYDSVGGYDQPVTYFPIDNMMHVGRTSNSLFFRIGILGPMDGHVRYGRTLFPYDKEVIEIVFGGWTNSKSVGRRQHHTAANANTNHQLGEAQTPNLLSPYRPVMFLLEVFNNGTVQVSLEQQGHRSPFLIFHDANKIPVNYLAFVKWASWSLVYFYDCPLEDASAIVMIAFALSAILVIVLSVNSGTANTSHSNSFDAIKGCLQFDEVPGYNDTPNFFATNTFRNVGRTSTSRYFRIGIVGTN